MANTKPWELHSALQCSRQTVNKKSSKTTFNHTLTFLKLPQTTDHPPITQVMAVKLHTDLTTKTPNTSDPLYQQQPSTQHSLPWITCPSPKGPLTPSISATVARHSFKLRVDVLFGLPEHFQQVWYLLGIGSSEEGVGRSVLITPGRPSDTVHVVLRRVRVVVVDDKHDVVHVWIFTWKFRRTSQGGNLGGKKTYTTLGFPNFKIFLSFLLVQHKKPMLAGKIVPVF